MRAGRVAVAEATVVAGGGRVVVAARDVGTRVVIAARAVVADPPSPSVLDPAAA